MNVVDLLQTSAVRHARRPAVTDVRAGRSLSYADLGAEVERVERFLIAEGVKPGQRIGLLAPNAIAHLPAAFGLLATGACLVPIATNLMPAEVARIASEVEINGVLAWPDADPLARSADRRTLSGGECSGYTFEWIARDLEGPPALAALNPAFIRFTSGTTADRKGVVLSHEATAARVAASDAVLRFTADDRIVWVLPLAYHFAVTIVAYVRAGAHVLLCADTLPATLVDSIRRLHGTVFYASPLHFDRMSNLAPTGPLGDVRLALSTSAPISAATMERFESVYELAVGQAYGIIEAGLPCINRGIDGLPATSVGRPVPGYEVAVFSDAGQRLPAGASGEIGLRGAGLFSAYYTPWRLREQVARDGWFLTGDIGRLDASDALFLHGRKKTVIFVAGLKFFPEEVEECINQFPGVKESRVFGTPHAHLGEVPRAEVAFATPSPDLGALKAHCARALSPYKVPVEFIVVEATARTPGGKLLRRVDAAPARAELA
ncbi:MAG TPA: class I adenylate-forming enzyme family protein [Methylomirabilota bacterium]|nr:class I adenylate-forming enzyme family protein [Methylomirabilota bacterium]